MCQNRASWHQIQSLGRGLVFVQSIMRSGRLRDKEKSRFILIFVKFCVPALKQAYMTIERSTVHSSSDRGCRKDLVKRICGQPTLNAWTVKPILLYYRRFLHFYPQNEHNASWFPSEIGCKNTKFFPFSQIYFPMSGKVRIFANAYWAWNTWNHERHIRR